MSSHTHHFWFIISLVPLFFFEHRIWSRDILLKNLQGFLFSPEWPTFILWSFGDLFSLYFGLIFYQDSDKPILKTYKKNQNYPPENPSVLMSLFVLLPAHGMLSLCSVFLVCLRDSLPVTFSMNLPCLSRQSSLLPHFSSHISLFTSLENVFF